MTSSIMKSFLFYEAGSKACSWICINPFWLNLSFTENISTELWKYFFCRKLIVCWRLLCCFCQAKPKDTLDLCHILNDDLAATVHKHSKRFIGLGTLPMQDPELAVQEMYRCVKELGFPGIQIGSHINDWDLNSHELYPVYAVSIYLF